MSGQNIELGIKLRYDGKEVDAGISMSRDTLQKFSAETKRAGALASESFNTASTSASAFGGALKGALAGISAGALIYGVKGATVALIDAQQAAQKLRNSLEYSAGGAAAAAGEIAYLRDVTRTLGLDFATASVAYSKFAASTRDSGISAAQTKTVFEGIAAASARMGLSADETQGALLALSQMASKGTVQAEELRGQLGERLPGALNIAAKAMGVTTAELGKMLEQGQVMASDFLPKFGEALKAQFQAPLNSLTQEINRLSSAWALWKTELSEGTDGGGFKWLTKGLNESAAAMHALGNEAGIVHKILVGIGGFEASVLGAGKFDTQALQAQAIEKLAKARERLGALEEKQANGKLNQVEREQLEHYTASVKAAREELLRLADVRGKETGIKLPDLKGEIAAQKAALDTRAKAYLGDTTNGSKAAKISAEVEKENKAYQAAIAGFSETDERYVKMLGEHNTRIAEIKAKAKVNTAGTKNDVSQQYAASLAAEKDFSAAQVKLIKARVAEGVESEEDGIKEVLAAQINGYAKERELLTAQLGATKDAGDKARLGQQIAAIGTGMQVAAAEYVSALAKIEKARENAASANIYDQALADYNKASSIEDATRAMREQTAELGLSSAALAALKQARIDDQIALESWRLGLLGGSEAAGGQADAIRETIAALEDRKVAMQENDRAQKAADAIKKQGEAWVSVEGAAHSAWGNIEKDGIGSVKRIGETIQSAVWDVLYQMTVKKWIVQISASVSGTAAAESAFGTAGTSTASSLSSTSSLLSGAKTAYDLYSGGTQSLFQNFATSKAGSLLGLSAMGSATVPASTSMGITIQGASTPYMTSAGMTANTMIPYIGWIVAGLMANSSFYDQGFTLKNADSTTKAIDASSFVLTSALEKIGLSGKFASMLTGNSIVNRMFGYGNKEVKATGTQGTFTADGFSGQNYAAWEQKGGWFRSDKSGTDTSAMSAEADSSLDTIVKASAASFQNLFRVMGEAPRSLDGWSFSIKQNLSSQDEMNAMIKSLADSMATRLVPEFAALQNEGESLSDTVIRMQSEFVATDRIVEMLGLSATAFGAVGISSAAARDALVDAAGGVDALSSGVATYFASFYSDAEKQALAVSDLSKSFAELGRAVPADEAALKAVVKSLDLTTDAGRATFAAMMKLAPSFATVADAAKKIADARDALMQKYADPSVSSATAIEYAKAAIKKSGVLDIDGLDANGIRGQLRQVIFGATQDTIDAINGLSGAFDTVIQGLTADVAAAAADRKELVSARRAAAAAEKAAIDEAAKAAADAWATRTQEFMDKRADYVKSGDVASIMSYEVARIEKEARAEFGPSYNAVEYTRAMRELTAAMSLRTEISAAALSQVDLASALTIPISAAAAKALADNARSESRAMYGVTDASPDSFKALAAFAESVRIPSMRESLFPSVGIAEVRHQRAMYGYESAMNSEMPKLLAAAMHDLNAQLAAGAIDAAAYAKAAEKVNWGEWAAVAVDMSKIVDAGNKSIRFYLDSMGELAKSTEEAGSALSLVNDMMGRMRSAATVFSESADAATAMGDYTTLSDKAYLIAAAARIAGEVATTQSAAEAAARLKTNPAIAGASDTHLRDMALLVDGVKAYDSVAFERIFNRLGSALGKDTITSDEYVALMTDSINVFSGVDAATDAVKTAMQSLADAMGSFADELLIDASKTTLNPDQSLAETMRQYEIARTSAMTGDSTSVGNYKTLATALLDKSKYESQADYNAAFGKIYGDARNLEALGVASVARANGENGVVSELKNLNTTLTKRVDSLEKNLTTALAQIARNTAKTSQGIEQINAVGIPA